MSGCDYNDHYSLRASLGIVATAKSYVASAALFFQAWSVPFSELKRRDGHAGNSGIIQTIS